MSTAENRFSMLRADEIVVLGHVESWESPSGHVETETEDIAFKRGEEFHLARIKWITKFLPSGFDHIVESDQIVPEAEYRAAVTGKPKDDIAGLSNRESERSRLEDEVMRSRPHCPQCERPMTSRNGSRGMFWGCPGYPKCKGSRNMTGTTKALLERASKVGVYA